MLLLRSKIFLYLHFGKYCNYMVYYNSWALGVVGINHFTFSSVKSGLTSLLRGCNKHFGPMIFNDWVWLSLPLVRQVKTAKLGSDSLED